MPLRTITFTTPRAVALRCGLLFDVSPHAQRAGFKAPVALTRAAFRAATEGELVDAVLKAAHDALLILLPGPNERAPCSVGGMRFVFAYHREGGRALVTVMLAAERY